MKSNYKKMLAALVKESKIAKGYTQQELSDLTNISTRSIQRIENGEITPRIYTIKTLSRSLGFSLEDLKNGEMDQKEYFKLNRIQKTILSAGASLFILFLAWAYTAQSPKFPETTFELFVFSALVISLMTGLLTAIWKTR